jgi:hypothetical protein
LFKAATSGSAAAIQSISKPRSASRDIKRCGTGGVGDVDELAALFMAAFSLWAAGNSIQKSGESAKFTIFDNLRTNGYKIK